MNRFSLGSLRVRLVLVVLIAIVPALGLIYYTAQQQRDAAVAQADDDVSRLTRLTAADYSRVIEGAHQMLFALAELPEVRGPDASRCGASMERLVGKYRDYSNLGVAGLNGEVTCSAATIQEPVSVADRSWFQQALQTHDFAVGEYQVGRISGRPSLNFGYPIMDGNSQAQGVVFASLDLQVLSRLLTLVMAPEGMELAVVDRNGVVLAHTPTKGNPVGQTAPEAALIKQVSTYRGRGTDVQRDSAGIERIYAFYPLGGLHTSNDMYVAASIPTDIAFAEADRGLRRSLIGLGLVALVALIAAWYGGEAIVLRHANDELEQRVQERTRELAHEQFLLRTLLDSVPDSIYFKDSKGRFLRSSRAQAQRFGLKDPAEAIGKTDFDFFKKEHAAEAFADEQQIMRTGQAVIGVEESSPLADGADRWVSTSKLPMKDKDGNIVGTFGISREITERKRAEKALAKERNLMRTLIDNLPDLVFIKDTRGRYVFDNTAHRAFLEVANLEDVVGKTAFDFYSRELAAPIHNDDTEVMNSEKPVLHRQDTLVDRKGRKIQALTSKIPYRDESHRIAGLVCISRLIEDRK